MMRLTGLYDDRARSNPAGAALRFAREPFEGESMTWLDLANRSHALASGLAERGIGGGHRVALVLADHPDLVPTLLALWRRETVVIPVDPQWGEGLRDQVLGHARADFLATVAGPAAIADLAPGRTRPPLPPGTAMISYTSGSTADPKGVMLGHGHLMHAYLAAARGLVRLVGAAPRRFGCALRLSGLGVLGMNYLWAAALGTEVVVLPVADLAAARSFFSLVDGHEIDLLYLVPAQAELLLRAAAPAGPAPGPRRRVCVCGGAPLRPQPQAALQDRFGLTMLNAYGLTEVAFAAFFGSVDADGRGRPDIGEPVTVRARLRAAGGTPAAGPAEGELELSGPSVAFGYYDNPGASAAVFRDGWVRTGDLAGRDAAGRYRITGRLKDVVLKGGFTVYLAEVEDAAMRLPGVVEAAAVRVDCDAGEDIGLVLRVDGSFGLAESGVAAQLHRALGQSRSPRRVALTGEPLPRTGNLKIDRRAALRMWETLCTG